MESEAIFLTREDSLSVILPHEIDHHAVKPIREKTDIKLFELSPGLLILDFSAVNFMDSSGIALILGRVETASEVGAKVHLDRLSPTLYKLVRLSGIERIKNLTVSP